MSSELCLFVNDELLDTSVGVTESNVAVLGGWGRYVLSSVVLDVCLLS